MSHLYEKRQLSSFTLVTCPATKGRSFHLSFRTLQHTGHLPAGRQAHIQCCRGQPRERPCGSFHQPFPANRVRPRFAKRTAYWGTHLVAGLGSLTAIASGSGNCFPIQAASLSITDGKHYGRGGHGQVCLRQHLAAQDNQRHWVGRRAGADEMNVNPN